jgi:Flp pilus assembly protein TadG
MARKFFSKLLQRKEGTTAIEFSLPMIPYLMLTLGIIELSVMFTTASLLEGSSDVAARMVRTGQIQQASNDPAEQEALFREVLCESTVVLIRCEDIFLEVLDMGAFSDYSEYAPIFDEDGNLVPRGFNAGGAGDVMLIRVAYRYNMMTPLVGPLLSGEDGSMLFMSTIVLQTEPYEFEGS